VNRRPTVSLVHSSLFDQEATRSSLFLRRRRSLLPLPPPLPSLRDTPEVSKLVCFLHFPFFAKMGEPCVLLFSCEKTPQRRLPPSFYIFFGRTGYKARLSPLPYSLLFFPPSRRRARRPLFLTETRRENLCQYSLPSFPSSALVCLAICRSPYFFRESRSFSRSSRWLPPPFFPPPSSSTALKLCPLSLLFAARVEAVQSLLPPIPRPSPLSFFRLFSVFVKTRWPLTCPLFFEDGS